MISKESIDEYKAIYKKLFNKDITDEEATRQAMNLLNLYRIIYAEASSGDDND